MSFNNPGWEWKCSTFDDDEHSHFTGGSVYGEINGYYTLQLWVSYTKDVHENLNKQITPGHSGSFRIFDNGNGTYSGVIEID